MKLIVCAVKDRAAEAFAQPMFVMAAGIAIRGFQDEINRVDDNNQMYKHSDDFDLYELGEFDDGTGLFSLHDQPKVLLLGKQVKNS